MKLGIIGYVPPPTFNNNIAGVFLENLRKNLPRAELLFYSDHHGYAGQNWYQFIPLKAPPEIYRNHPNAQGQKNDWALNNAIWITGMFFAAHADYSHIIYLEADCRVNRPDWDLALWEEYFNLGRPLVAAGSLVCWNPTTAGMAGLRRWEQLLASNQRRNFPIPTYGFGSTYREKTPAVYPNGALGIYDMAWLKTLFDVTDTQAAVRAHAWDHLLGEKIWSVFGLQSYDVVAHMESIFSSYGEVVSTESERLHWLKHGWIDKEGRTKNIVAVHQVKSHATV